MSFCFPCYPFIYCVCSGSVRGRFFRILAPTAQHCGGWLSFFALFCAHSSHSPALRGYRLAQFVDAFLKFWFGQPSTLQASFYTVFLRKPLLFSLVSGLLEKSAQNSLERYRYGAPRLALRQNFKKSPHDLGALFLLPLARSLNSKKF